MKNDVISRQVAIDALECKKDKNAKGDMGGFYNKIIQNDIDTLMQLPDNKDLIEKIKNGITASDGNSEYFIGLRNGMRWCLSLIDDKEPIYELDQRWIPCSERLPEALQEVIVTSTSGRVYTSRIVHGDFEYGGNVVAWMPLPEPYHGE